MQLDAANHAVTATASNYSLFLGAPIACADTKHTLTVRSVDEIVGVDENDLICAFGSTTELQLRRGLRGPRQGAASAATGSYCHRR